MILDTLLSLPFRKGIQLAHVGECTTLKETEQCPEDCSEVPEEPVCGSDGNVYRWLRMLFKFQAICRFKTLSFRKLRIINYFAYCKKKKNELSSFRYHFYIIPFFWQIYFSSMLIFNINHIYKSYSYVFRSLCHLRRETCGQRVVQVPAQHCRTTALCNQICSGERQFVCGSDNKLYRNECEMKRDNCG